MTEKYKIPSKEEDILKSLGFDETLNDGLVSKWKYQESLEHPDIEEELILGRNYDKKNPNGKFWAGFIVPGTDKLEFLNSYEEIRGLNIAQTYYQARSGGVSLNEFSNQITGEPSNELSVKGKESSPSTITDQSTPTTECAEVVTIQPISMIEEEPTIVIRNSLADLNPRLSEVGKIKIGGKGEERISKKGNTYSQPVSYDHFKIGEALRGLDGKVVIDEETTKIIGDEAKKIDIILCYNDIESNFPHWYARYEGGKCICRGDGEYAQQGTNGDTKIVACNRLTCKYYKSKKCKPNGILNVILMDAPVVGGVHVFRTTSIYSIMNIVSSLQLIQTLTGGQLAGIPLQMTLTPKRVTPVGMSTAHTIYVVNIEYPGTISELMNVTQRVVHDRQLIGTSMEEIEERGRKMIAETIEETPEEIQHVEDEYYRS